jgi:hypothetical protein
MRTMMCAILVCGAGCFGSNDAALTPYTNWIYTTADGTEGLGLTLNKDGTYSLYDLYLYSPTQGEVQIESGIFNSTGFSSGTITFTPKEWSCGANEVDAQYVGNYTLNSSNLNLAYKSEAVSLVASESAPGSGFALTVGCFDNFFPNGFVESPMVPVSN